LLSRNFDGFASKYLARPGAVGGFYTINMQSPYE
jgi:hypothetical protein